MVQKWTIIGAVAAAVIIGSVVFLTWFAPEATTDVAEERPDGTTLASGEWAGADRAHQASGSIELIETASGLALHFEAFDATSGPDVYLFVSPRDDGDFGDDAVKVLVPGGAKDGQITLRGDFTVPLPDTISASDVASAILWCEDFGVHFGSAILR